MSESKQRRGIIYKLHCIPEDKDYVGQTRRSFKKRWSEHATAVEKFGWESATLVDRKIAEFGEDSFECEILERPFVEDLNDRERYWISECGSLEPDGYNRTAGGGVVLRIELTDAQQQEIVESYLNGEGSDSLAKRFNCSTAFIVGVLNGFNIAMRSHNETTVLKRKNVYCRLDPKTGKVLEEYKSFALIGKWAQENGLTKNANSSTAGMRTRYAMLFGTDAYGYKWSASWTEEEKEERRAKFKESSMRSHMQENAKSIVAPSRQILKRQLNKMTRKDILELYDISHGCLDNWRFFYCLGPDGEDLDGWENAPEQYTKSLNGGKALPYRPSYEALRNSLEMSTITEAAKSFGVDTHIYKRWLKESGLPSNRKDINNLVGHSSKTTENRKGKQRMARKTAAVEAKEKEELLETLFTCETIAEGAKKIGVSDVTYVARLKKYGLPSNRKEIDLYLIQHGKEARPSPYRKESACPSREEIKEELRSGKSFCELARKHHVSDNAYRKWCRNLNLPDSPAVIKRIPIAEWDYACEHWEEVKDRYGNKQQNVRVSEQEKKLLKRLYCKEKRSVSEIAQIIKRDPGTVKKYLRQAGVEIV